MRDATTQRRSERPQALCRRSLETVVRAIVRATLSVPLLLGTIDTLAQTAPGTGRTVAAAGSIESGSSDRTTLEQVVVTGQHITAPAEVPMETAYSESTITADTIRALSAGPTPTRPAPLNSP